MAASILLQGGTLLLHGHDDHVESVKADLLIEGSIITRIESDIEPSSGTHIIDCRDKVISPGFIDTHHHVWQTLQRGRYANQLLLEYMATGMPLILQSRSLLKFLGNFTVPYTLQQTYSGVRWAAVSSVSTWEQLPLSTTLIATILPSIAKQHSLQRYHLASDLSSAIALPLASTHGTLSRSTWIFFHHG